MAVSINISIDGFDDSLTIRKLTGSEEMSRCYYYNVIVEIATSSLDKFTPIGQSAKLYFTGNHNNELSINSKISESIQITDPSMPADKARFKLTLVPELWFIGLGEQTKIYIDMTFQDILTDQFDANNIKNKIYGLDGVLCGEKPLVTQYKESNLNFVSRLMESKGVYYYFDHNEADMLVISDDQQNYGNLIDLDEHSEIEPGTWSRITRISPTKVRLTGYDFRQPSYNIYGEADSGDNIGYEIHVDDEPVRDQEEAMQLAQIRLEQQRVYSDYVTFRAFNYNLCPGAQFKKDGKEYVVTQVSHSYVHEDTQKGGEANHYRNSVLAIRSDVIFRPEIITKIPYAEGTEIAHIYSETSSDIAMIDEEGLYTVKLNYVSDKDSGARLGRLRMQQPASGEHDGIYFPLKDGTEVLIAFTKGNPDLPYIHGTMSNGRFPSHVVGGRDQNPHHSVIKARHMMVLKSLGGYHLSHKTNEYDVSKQEYDLNGEDDHTFLKLEQDGTSSGEMSELDEQSGDYHIERRYGHKYSFINGNNYNWDNSSTYNFGNGYEEYHENTDSAENSFDLTSEMSKHADSWEEKKNGIVKKMWGDRVEYHNGRTMVWGEKDSGPLEQYHYGSRYSERQVDVHGERVSGGPDWEGQTGFVEKTEGDVFVYHNGNVEDKSEGDINIERTGNTTEKLEGDTEFKRTGKLKATHDGEVESEFMDKVTTTTHGNIKESMMGDVETSVTGKVKVTLDGGRETKETQNAKHEFMAPLTLKLVSIDETTSGTKKETIKGPHTIEYSASVSEKGAQLKSQEAQMLQMKGSTASIKIDLIMLG